MNLYLLLKIVFVYFLNEFSLSVLDLEVEMITRRSGIQLARDSTSIGTKLELNKYLIKHRWFSGRMLACHAGGPGSIPGRCSTLWGIFEDNDIILHAKNFILFNS